MSKFKRWLGGLLICTMLIALIGAAPFTAAGLPCSYADDETLIGDTDGDGVLTIIDATVIQRHLAGLPVSVFDEKAADADGDGKVTIVDATYIQRRLAGLIGSEEKPDNDALYKAAVRDAIFIDEDEVLPLVNITRDDKNVIWNGDKVLVAFLHKYPDSYPAGEEIELKWGNVWCVSAAEMDSWVNNNGEGIADWTERLHQLMGMPTSKGYNTVTALWVDADLLVRPANVTDPAAPMQATYQPTGDEAFDAMYQEWFASNAKWSYVDSAYPWTRLGYTYDWADNGAEYGLSEFMIFSGAPATVAYTCTIDEYVAQATASSFTISQIQKHGNVVLSVKGSDFLDMGYSCGDLLNVTINGQTLTMPVGSEYSDVDQGEMICRVEINSVTGDDNVILAINMGDFATTLGIAEKEKITEDPGYIWHYKTEQPVAVKIAMKEKGGYYDQWVMHRLVRSDVREDYPGLTDAEYANFREITTTGMGDNKLYRASSPVRPKLNRNKEADAASAAAGIRTIVNLADDEETMLSYDGYSETYYAGQNIIALCLGMDFFNDEFRAGLAEGFRYIATHDGPYLVHCNEGKDRTGFFCAVAEALMGAGAEEITADYMITYDNFYGVKPDTERYDVIARSNIQKTLAAAFGMDSVFDGDLQEKAVDYLTGVGLTAEEIALVREKLG